MLSKVRLLKFVTRENTILAVLVLAALLISGAAKIAISKEDRAAKAVAQASAKAAAAAAAAAQQQVSAATVLQEPESSNPSSSCPTTATSAAASSSETALGDGTTTGIGSGQTATTQGTGSGATGPSGSKKKTTAPAATASNKKSSSKKKTGTSNTNTGASTTPKKPGGSTKTPPPTETPATQPATTPTAVIGSIVEHGSFGGQTLKWRILNLDSKRALLLADSVVTAGAYQSDEFATAPNDYAKSDIRAWLTKQFIPQAFGSAESASKTLLRSSASDALAGDLAWLLTPSQLARLLPEAEDRIASGTNWATMHPAFNNEHVKLASGTVQWWLAPEPDASAAATVPTVKANGGISKASEERYVASYADGLRPVIKLNLVAVKLAAKSGSQNTFIVAAR